MAAVSILMACTLTHLKTGGYALIAPVLSDINEDIGPSANITWVSIVYVLCEAVFFLLVGRLSDLFGRRWFVC